MQSKKTNFVLSLAIITFVTIFYSSAFAQNTATSIAVNSQIKDAIKEVLKENPNLVLDVLKENSELVLEIAQQAGKLRQRNAITTKWRSELNTPVNIDFKNHPIRGNKNAPVTIVAFSDFTCPYCQAGDDIISKIMKERKDKVRFVFKHLPRKGPEHPYARLASEYVVAAFMQDEVKGWEFYDTVFANREQLLTDGEKFLQDAAKKVGLNTQKLSTDIKSRNVKALIDADIAEAEALGVKGTPNFFVNNLNIPGFVPEEFFNLALDLALENKTK